MDTNIQPLMLQSSQIPLVQQNPLNINISCLPYVDLEENEQIKSQVNRLIQEEMVQMPKKDYLENLPEPELTCLNREPFKEYIESLQGQIEQKQQQGIDMQKYEIPDDTTGNTDESIDRIKLLQQYLNLKKLNMEIMGKYGATKWKNFLEDLDKGKQRLEELEKKAKFEVDEINAQRKFNQYEGLSLIHI
eukprot:TRINITY_DN5528_c0_g1_i1.p1 TRINITY_DN5528_c0_g1~~TRINITY_DN5528_c0_g1_i1.p1  ORF type:complete len:190 (-),score=42.84 TRINITY_DN5528_c0_g1_i1:63-632(-)